MTGPASRADRRRIELDRRRVEELAAVIAGACPDGRMRHPRVLAAIILTAGWRKPRPQRHREPPR